MRLGTYSSDENLMITATHGEIELQLFSGSTDITFRKYQSGTKILEKKLTWS